MNETILHFSDREAFRLWLEANHTGKESIWLELFKGRKGVLKHTEALEEALCFGWIDSLIKRVDEKRYRVKFSPRREGSNWSERNKKIVTELIREGRMAPPGLAKAENARTSGEWDRMPLKISDAQVEELSLKLKEIPTAFKKFSNATPAVRKLMTRYYFAAKRKETRARRLARITDSLETGKPIM